MTYTEKAVKAGEYLRLAISNIAKHNLPANPINYTVWYEYAAGKNLKLKRVLDQSLKKNEPLTNEKVESLYQKYIIDGDRVVIGKVLTEVSLMLKEVVRHVADTEGDLAGSGENLEKLAVQLENVEDYSDIREVVDQMIIETKKLVKSGKRLQNKMLVSSDDLKLLYKELEKSQQEAQTDELTQLINRRGLENRFDLEITRSGKTGLAFSIILLDIDHFKKVNDTFGHLVGDGLLKSLASLIKSQLRKDDVAARYGGEEFIILLPETKLDGAQAVANKLKATMAVKEWKLKGSGKSMGKITVSMGVAVYDLKEGRDDLVKRADDALYNAKETGRDKIVTQEDI